MPDAVLGIGNIIIIIIMRSMATLINTLVLSLVLVISFMSSRSSTVQGLPFPIPSFNNCDNFEGCCPPPYNQTFQHFYKFDTKLPMRTRRPAHLLDDAYIAKYQKAYELLRALPDSDGRSWKNQAKLHCAYCDTAFFFPKAIGRFQVHYSWVFFPWHRFFLYFHERILAKLLNDDTFALPFWEWDNQTPEPPLANSLPEVYVNPTYQNSKESSLYDVNRNPCAYPPNIMDLQLVTECDPQTAGLQAALRGSNNRLMYNQMVTGAPVNRLFFGEAYRLESWPGLGAGTIEAFPHGTVHDWTGDPSAKVPTSDMGLFRFSAYDPVFYAHHGNIDRLWDLWKSLPGDYRNDITDPDYLNTEFLFYDENGDLVKVKIAQALDIGNTFRYNYENVSNSWLQEGSDAAFPSCYPASNLEINKLILNTPPLNTNNITTFASSTVTFRVRRPAKSINNSCGEEVLVIGGLNIGSDRFLLNAFLFFPTANANTTISCPQFFGKLSNSGLIFGVDLPDSEKEWRLAITPKLGNLGLDNVSHVVVTLVQVGIPQHLQFKTAKIEYFQ